MFLVLPPPSGSLSGSTLTLRPAGTSGVLGVVEPGATAVVSFQVTVNSAAAQTTIRNSASVSSDNGIAIDNFTTNEVANTVNAAADVKIQKGFTSGTIASAGTVTMYFVVTNLGPSTASNVTISDVVPSSLTISGALPAGCSTAQSGGNTVLTCVINSMTLNQSETISLNVDAATTATPIEVFNTARISSASFDPNPVNDVAIAPLSIRPDTTGALKIQKVSSPTATTAGGKAGWIISVHNAGSSATSGPVTLSDPAVQGFTATSITVIPAINNQGGDPTVTCTLGATPLCTFPSGINAGNSYTVVISGNLASTVGNGTVLTNTASLSNGQSSSATITANNVADVVVLKELTTSAEAGVPLGYQVTVINAGPSAAVNTVITDTLPAGTTLLNIPSGCTNSGQTLTCSLGTLATGSVTTLVYQVSIPDAGGTFTNLAVATSDTPFLDAITPEASVTVTIAGLAHTGSLAERLMPFGVLSVLLGSLILAGITRRSSRTYSQNQC